MLRFVLDAHPELACPPETNLPVLCGQLANVWSLIEGAPLSANRGDEPPVVPDGAVAGVRETMDRMTGSYLARRGKKKYCDKSLGTAGYADLLLRIYPAAAFVCLYRHPMDVIASGMEACPWGLGGYGFDSYIAATPGNAVLALSRYWTDNATAIMSVEERFPDRCIRVRYEDLVTDPEGTASALFAFLGVRPQPGIATRCFSAERERFGPGDHKIWYTSTVSPGSMGRGWSIPPGLIAPPVLATMNELAGKLGYVPVDDNWGTSAPPADLRLPIGAASAAKTAAAPVTTPRSHLLGSRLRANLEKAAAEGTAGWEPHGSETAVVVWLPAEPGQPAEHWLIDLKNLTVTLATSQAQQDSDWDVVGSAAAWDQVMAGNVNLSVALRSCQLRYCDGDTSPGPLAPDSRAAILGCLLGIGRW